MLKAAELQRLVASPDLALILPKLGRLEGASETTIRNVLTNGAGAPYYPNRSNGARGNIPGYGPLQALNRLSSNAPGFFYRGSDGLLYQAGIQGNPIEVISPGAFDALNDPTGLYSTTNRLNEPLSVQYRRSALNGTSDRFWSEPDWATARLHGFSTSPVSPVDGSQLLRVQLQEAPGWTPFPLPGRTLDNTAAANLLRDRLNALPRADLENALADLLKIDAASVSAVDELDREVRGLYDSLIDWLDDGRALNSSDSGWVWNHDVATGSHTLVPRRVHDQNVFEGVRHTGGNQSHGDGAKRLPLFDS